MKTRYIVFMLILIPYAGIGQMVISDVKEAGMAYNLHSYSDHQQFEGHTGYAAPIFLTADGGAAFFGDLAGSVNIIKLASGGQLGWNVPIRAKFNVMETKSIIQDNDGNYYAFVLSYNYAKYRGSTERIISLTKDGNMLCDIKLGDYELENNPHCSYIRLADNGQLELRGHIVVEPKKEGADPEYHFWSLADE